MKDMKVSVIICAAGKGDRAGFGKNKLLAPLFGAPVLYHTLKKFHIPQIDEVIVAAAKADYREISAMCAHFGFTAVRGGSTRTESVKRALKKVTGEIVLIHDGARPFVKAELILNCIETVKKFGSAVPAIHFTDTAVRSQYGVITEWAERNDLYRVQTPQGFLTEDIRRAYDLADGKTYTDDSAVFGEFIAPPRIIAGDEENVKLTYKSDFPREYPLVSATAGQKIGFGVDVHCFGEGDFVTLAGVQIPCDNGLVAHSDGDVITHAVMDALLSAAGLKDIGHYFPDNDEKFADADSGELLKKVVQTVENAGYSVGNLSVTVQAERPRLAPYIDQMKKNLGALCGIDISNIGLAAGTCEHLGFVGEGLGIAAYCAALLNNK